MFTIIYGTPAIFDRCQPHDIDGVRINIVSLNPDRPSHPRKDKAKGTLYFNCPHCQEKIEYIMRDGAMFKGGVVR